MTTGSPYLPAPAPAPEPSPLPAFLSRRWPVLLLFVLASLALYANAIPNDFVFDDTSTLRRNPVIRRLDRLPELFTVGSYRPIRYLSFALDYQVGMALFGEDRPYAYHVFNALYHGIVCFLVWRLLLRLLADPRAALAGALLFLAHPAHTESVAYISGRRDLLTTLFYLVSFLAFLRWREAEGRAAIGWAAASLAALALALGSKEMAVTLPAVVVLYEVVFDRAALRRHALFYALGFALAGFVIRKTIDDDVSKQDFFGGSAEVHYLTAVRLVASYVRLIVFPATLLADYNQGAFALSKGWSDPWTLGPLALLLALAAAALASLKRAPRVSFGLGWFALTLAPVAQIVPYHELGADHYVYLPSIGLLMIAGTGFALLWDRLGRGPALGALVAVLAAFVVRTEVRILDWRSAEALFRATLATAPNSARASLNIGVQIASRPARDGTGQSVHILEALPYFDRAIEIDPEYIYAYLTRAKAYRHLGREVEAVASLERALELARRADDPPVESDEILILLRRFAEARVLLQVKCANPRAKPNVIYRLGICRAALGDRRGALECLIRIVEGGRYGTKVAVEGMQAAASLGDHARAAWFFERLEAINPETARQIAEATARARELSAAAASRPPTATAAPVERRLDE